MGKLTLCLGLAVVLAACSHGPHGHSHGERGHDHGEVEHGHDHVVIKQHTLYSDHHEAFVEHPPLVAGEEGEWVVHLTRLSDWRPAKVGVALQFTRKGASPVNAVAAASEAGIYTAKVRVPSAGSWRVAFQISDGATKGNITTDVQVYGDAAQAADAPRGDMPFNQPWFSPLAQAVGAVSDKHEEVVFLKQQQWLVPFRSEPLIRDTFRPSLAVYGEISARAGAVAVVHAPVAGRVIPADSQLASFGQRVTKGRLLATLLPRFEAAEDPASLSLALRQAELEHAYAQKDFERVESLAEQGMLSQEILQRAELAVATSLAERQAAQQRLKQFAGFQQSENAPDDEGVALFSPIDGVVQSGHAVAGGLVVEDEDLWRIVNLDRVWLRLAVPEQQIHRVRDSQAAWFRVAEDGPVYEVNPAQGARLVAVGDEVSPQTRTVPVVFEIDNRDGALKLGMQVQAGLVTGPPENGWSVPAQAVIEETGAYVVYGQVNGETFSRRVVRIGLRDSGRIQILEGLNGVTRVVTEGAYPLRLAGSETAVPDHGHVH